LASGETAIGEDKMSSSTNLLRAQLGLLLALTSVYGGVKFKRGEQSTDTKSCSDISRVSPNSRKKIIRLSTKETREQAIKQVAPNFPPRCRCEGPVVVEILVNADGQVICTHVVSGLPLMRATSVNAAKEWTFKQVTINGVAVPFLGLLVFSFKDGEVKF
jgi:outer membrane biosynthesis protein TonB